MQVSYLLERSGEMEIAGIRPLHDAFVIENESSSGERSSQLDVDDTWQQIVLLVVKETQDNDEITEANEENAASDDDDDSPKAEVWLVAPHSFDQYDLITVDEVGIRDVETLQPHQYALRGYFRQSVHAIIMHSQDSTTKRFSISSLHKTLSKHDPRPLMITLSGCSRISAMARH